MVINSILGFAVLINFITIWKDVYNIIYFQFKSILSYAPFQILQ